MVCRFKGLEKEMSVPSSQSAFILCDAWDKHWCRGANERLEELIEGINELFYAARKSGVLICHSPAEVIGFYSGDPARERVKKVAPLDIPLSEYPNGIPPLRLNYDCDTSNNPGKRHEKLWSRQHKGILIDQNLDIISEEPKEISGFFHQRNIKNIFFLGIHVNVCLLHRPFGIIGSVRRGYNAFLVRDLTDSICTPSKQPFVSHEEGTLLSIKYIEEHWCPSVLSKELISDFSA